VTHILLPVCFFCSSQEGAIVHPGTNRQVRCCDARTSLWVPDLRQPVLPVLGPTFFPLPRSSTFLPTKSVHNSRSPRQLKPFFEFLFFQTFPPLNPSVSLRQPSEPNHYHFVFTPRSQILLSGLSLVATVNSTLKSSSSNYQTLQIHQYDEIRLDHSSHPCGCRYCGSHRLPAQHAGVRCTKQSLRLPRYPTSGSRETNLVCYRNGAPPKCSRISRASLVATSAMLLVCARTRTLPMACATALMGSVATMPIPTLPSHGLTAFVVAFLRRPPPPL